MPSVFESQMYSLAGLVNAIRQSFRTGIERGPRSRHLAIEELTKLESAFRAMGDHIRETGGRGNAVAISFAMEHFVREIGPRLSEIIEDPDQVQLVLTPEQSEQWAGDFLNYTPGMLSSEALLQLCTALDQWIGAILPQSERERVMHALPQDKTAAAQFTASNGKIVVAPFTSEIVDPDRATAEIVWLELANRAGQLADELSQSNCDRRILIAFGRMRDFLRSRGSPVLVELAKMEFEAVSETAADTIPDVLAALLRAHVRAVSMLLAQYPEWLRFIQNADNSQLADNSAQPVAEALDQITTTLNGRSELADPEVPRLFAYLRECVTSPHRALRRTLYAAVNTMGNLVKAIVAHPIKSAALVSLAIEITTRLGLLQPNASWVETVKTLLKNLSQ